MRGLQPPPKEDTPSRLAARFLGLVILAAATGMAIYTAVTNQRVDLTEDVRTVGLELVSPSEVSGLTVNVSEDAGTGSPVVFLHDVDVTGGLLLADLSASVGQGYQGVRVDMPGFGLSERLPSIGPWHTASGMADLVAEILQSRFDSPVLLVGIGFGGEVGAELAYSYPDLVSGLVMVDVDFGPESGFELDLERLPWVGKAATYTWETGGRFAVDKWAPYCDSGGWCPTVEQLEQRARIVEVENSTDSIHAHRRTAAAALAPANLEDITVPAAYVWSTNGAVGEEVIEGMTEGLAGLTVVESATYQAHLEDHAAILSALAAISG